MAQPADGVSALARGLRHEVSRPPSTRSFVPVGCRWVVERTFAWLNFFRRLIMDYEYTPERLTAWICGRTLRAA